MKIIGRETRFIKQTDQINVARIVQFERSAFAHRKADHATRRCDVILTQPRQFAAFNFSTDKTLQRDINGMMPPL